MDEQRPSSPEPTGSREMPIDNAAAPAPATTAPEYEAVPAPRRRTWKGSLGMAIALVLAFVWGGIAYREMSPARKIATMIPGTASAAVSSTAVLGNAAPPQWVNEFASAFCKGDAQSIAPRIGPPLTNNVQAIQNALSDRDWQCKDIRFSGGGANPKGSFFMFITRDGENAEQWWVFTVVGDQVVAIE